MAITKTLTAIRLMSGKTLTETLAKDNITVTLNRKNIATVSKYQDSPGTPPTTPAPSDAVPADIIDLSKWTLMQPVADPQGEPANDYPERLVVPNIFFVRPGDSSLGVVFRTRADGIHSKNSSYPRTELREMKDDKWGKAAWSNKTGTHTLELVQAITHLPVVKPHLVSAQLHDGSDDILQIRLEGKRLMVMYDDGNKTHTLDDNYILGTKFTVKIVAANSRVRVFYNGKEKADLGISGSGWFAKAGCYLQTNVSKGDKPDAYGEVVIYKLQVSHE